MTTSEISMSSPCLKGFIFHKKRRESMNSTKSFIFYVESPLCETISCFTILAAEWSNLHLFPLLYVSWQRALPNKFCICWPNKTSWPSKFVGRRLLSQSTGMLPSAIKLYQSLISYCYYIFLHRHTIFWQANLFPSMSITAHIYFAWSLSPLLYYYSIKHAAAELKLIV
jgi:hypothetical protein